MRILIVVPFFAPAWGYGGPPRVMYDFGRALVRRGHSVTVLTTDAFERDRRISRRRDVVEGISVIYSPNLSNRLAWYQKIFLPLGFPVQFLRELRRTDVVICSDFRTFQNAVAYPLLRLAHVPFVLAAFGSLPPATGWKRPIKLVFDSLVGRGMLRNAASLLAQSEQEAEEYRRHGAMAPIDVLPLAVDLDEFSEMPARGELRRELGIGQDERIVLFLGRLHEYKGLGILLDAFAQIARSVPKARLVLVGRDDGYQAAIEAQAKALGIQDRVILAGPRYGRDRLAAYADADVFVLPAIHQEETPLAGLEAAACGCPVIVSRQALIPGLAESGGGMVIDATAGAVADAVISLLVDEDRRRFAGDAARRLVLGRFSLDIVAAQLERLLTRAKEQREPVEGSTQPKESQRHPSRSSVHQNSEPPAGKKGDPDGSLEPSAMGVSENSRSELSENRRLLR